MRISAAAAGTLICSLAFACVADVHASDKRNGDAPIQKEDQRDHKGAHLPVYRIKSLCPLGYGCVPVGMNARGEASGHVWRWFEDGSESPVLAFVWHPTTDTIEEVENTLGGSTRPERIRVLFGGERHQQFWMVTGSSEIAGPDHSHAFLWNDGALLDLNALVAPDDPLRRYVTLNSGVAINDAGRILATGTDGREVGFGYHAYVLSPR